MSNALAIAAVTASLRNLLAAGIALDPDLADTTFTTQPLDQARANGNSANQVNVFLYQTLPNAAWRNMDPPQVRPGESGFPPLALDLHYLLTPYGRDNDVQGPFSQQLLGRVMSTLHDHPLLSADEIRAALPGNDLAAQIERIRFTLQPLTLDDSFRLWSGFQTQFRLSAAYEASVVLIDSLRPARTPLPILTRGRSDSGIFSQPNLDNPLPTLLSVTGPNDPFGVQIGDTVTLTGTNLDGATAAVFKHPRLPAFSVPAQPGGTPTQFSVLLAANAGPWLAGAYTVAATKPAAGSDTGWRSINSLSLLLVPTIQTAFPINTTAAAGTAALTLSVVPEVAPEQPVSLLLGDREVIAQPRTGNTSGLQFTIADALPGEYLTRVRVDEADSLLVDQSGAHPVFRDRKVVIA